MLWFFLGLVVGAAVIWIFFLSVRREIVHLDEGKQQLQQEKQIVVEFMHNLVEAIGEGAERKELFERIVHAAVLSTGALSACVFECTGDGKLIAIAVEGLFPPQRPVKLAEEGQFQTRTQFIESVFKPEAFEIGEGVVGSVARFGEAVLIANARKDPRVVQHKDPSLQMRSLVVAPLSFRNETIGVLAVANPSDGSAFNEMDYSLVQSLADQAALAIHNSDLMKVQIEKNKIDFDLEMASTVQGMLMPKTFPKTASLDIDAFYRPAQKIGGDLYDVFNLDEDRVAFAIADVSGKGISASLLMAICRTDLRHYARKYHDRPTEVMCAMNRSIGSEIREDMFVTFIYGVIDTRKHELTLVRAGHELPLLLHKDEQGSVTVSEIDSEGIAVGMFPCDIFDSAIEEKVIGFAKNDMLVFYTDGVTEASNEEGEEFSSERLLDLLRTLRNCSAKGVNEGIVSSIERFTGENQIADDLTLITVKQN